MEFQAVIGLEIHAQLATKTKMFCRCDNDSWNKKPNVNVCPVCMGFPGQLPVTNKEAVKKGIIAALALNCKILPICKFDRKNYFYPDNPKGFQISQFDEPLSEKGEVDAVIRDKEGKSKRTVKVGITRLHLEDDAGKLTHVRNGSLVDFNRAGTPLMEIVTEPDMHSSAEAAALAREVQKIVRYVGSSEADMEKGMMRFDASVSIRPKGEKNLYPRAEIKNLNSFKALQSAIDYEINRQVALWKDDKPLNGPTTVGWDDEKQATYFLREKEESDDYRYFPEPDIPPLKVSKKMLDELRAKIPEMPDVKMKRYVEKLGVQEADARILSSDVKIAQYFEEVVGKCNNAKMAVSFINTVLMKYLREDLIEIDEQKVDTGMMAELIELVDKGEISNNHAKEEVFEEMYKTGARPGDIVEKKGLKQVSDEGAIEKVCKKVIDANPQTVEDFKAGKEKAIGFLVGQVMKEMKGQANPQIVNAKLKALL